jgi:hypothetical protein
MSNIKKLNKINGSENVLYWSDISSEICFIIPNGGGTQSTVSANQQTTPSTQNDQPPSTTAPTPTPTTTTSSLDDSTRAKYQSVPNDIRVLIVWLEQYQDADQLPLDELIHETMVVHEAVSAAAATTTVVGTTTGSTTATTTTTSVSQPTGKQREIVIIFIHPLKNRLNRVSMWSSVTRKYFYTMPLIDGMVVSSKMLSSMVRQTVLNVFRRKRLEIDEYVTHS